MDNGRFYYTPFDLITTIPYFLSGLKMGALYLQKYCTLQKVEMGRAATHARYGKLMKDIWNLKLYYADEVSGTN